MNSCSSSRAAPDPGPGSASSSASPGTIPTTPGDPYPAGPTSPSAAAAASSCVNQSHPPAGCQPPSARGGNGCPLPEPTGVSGGPPISRQAASSVNWNPSDDQKRTRNPGAPRARRLGQRRRPGPVRCGADRDPVPHPRRPREGGAVMDVYGDPWLIAANQAIMASRQPGEGYARIGDL